jgi:hypothetical protein
MISNLFHVEHPDQNHPTGQAGTSPMAGTLTWQLFYTYAGTHSFAGVLTEMPQSYFRKEK